MPPETGERVWEMMAAFAGYGFPKAHAASYAQVAWRSAWCKTHFPAEFMAAVLANWGGYYSQRVYLTRSAPAGAGRPPAARQLFRAEFQRRASRTASKVLFMGLDQVRDLTRRTQRAHPARPAVPIAGGFPGPGRSAPAGGREPGARRCAGGLGTIPAILQRLEGGSGKARRGSPGS